MKPALTHDADCILTRGDLAAADWPSLVIWMGHCPRPRSTNVSRFLQLLLCTTQAVRCPKTKKRKKGRNKKKSAIVVCIIRYLYAPFLLVIIH